MNHPTRQQLLDTGVGLLLKHGYSDLGIAALLEATGIPKGSFYHHFDDKEAFALAVVDEYMTQVHRALDATLLDEKRPPLERVRGFFHVVAERYRQEGYMGCLLGGLGQELSGISDAFRRKVRACLDAIAQRLAACLELAVERGDLAGDADTRQLAGLLVDCWEGAALRSRLQGNAAPLNTMLDFYFQSIAKPGPRRALSLSKKRRAPV